MSFLRKRRKKYYICFSRTINGDTREIVRTLKTGNRELAEKRQKVLNDKVKEGKDPFDPDFDFCPWESIKSYYTVKECCREFLEIKKKKYRYYTYKSYKEVLNRWIRYEHVADWTINHLQTRHIERFLMRDGIKNVSRHSEKRKIKTFWGWCLDQGRVEEDIVGPIDLPQKDVEYYPKMITKEELEELFKAFKKHARWKRKQDWYQEFMEQPWFIPAMAVFFYSGFRRSEVGIDKNIAHSGLKGRNILHRDRQQIDFIYLQKGKTNKERFVPVSKDLQQHLMEYFKARGWPDPDEYVFVSAKGEPVAGRRMLDVFKEYCEMAGIPDTRTIHGMRHSRGTLWLKMGFTLKDVKEMLGHYSVEITDRLYTHLTPDALKNKLDRFENGD